MASISYPYDRYEYFYNGIIPVRLTRSGGVLVCAERPDEDGISIDNTLIHAIVSEDWQAISALDFNYYCALYRQNRKRTK